jgi:hypothetical protein
MERSVGKQNNEIQRLQQLLAQHDIDYVEWMPSRFFCESGFFYSLNFQNLFLEQL